MTAKTRLYVWIKTTDANGEIAKNATDIVSVEIHTQETLWNFPDDYDYKLANGSSTPQPYVVENSRPDSIMNGVDFEIIDDASTFSLQDILNGLRVRYAPDGVDRVLKVVYYSPNQYTNYSIEEDVLTSLMSTFRVISLDLRGQQLSIPQKNIQLASYLILKNCTVNVPLNPIMIIDGFESYGCDYSSQEEKAVITMTISKAFTFSGNTIQDNINFNIQSKNNQQTQWQNCLCTISSVSTKSSLITDVARKPVFSISNFYQVKVGDIVSNVTNPWQSLIKVYQCVYVAIRDIIQTTSVRRNISLIVIDDCTTAVVDSISDNSISGYTIGFSAQILSNLTISDCIQNTCGILNISSVEIGNLSLDNMKESSKQNNTMIQSKILTASSVSINNSTVDISFLNTKSISNLNVDSSIALGSASLAGISNLVFNNSEIDTDTLSITMGISSLNKSFISIDNTIVSSSLNLVGYIDTQGVRYTNATIGSLSRITGIFNASKMLMFTFEEIKVQSPLVSIETSTLGSSYLDVDTALSQKISIEANAINLFQPSIFRTASPFELDLVNVKSGSVNPSFRDIADCSNQSLTISLLNCMIPIVFYNESMRYVGTTTLTSVNSVGSSFSRNDATVRKFMNYKLDSQCSDFTKFSGNRSNMQFVNTIILVDF